MQLGANAGAADRLLHALERGTVDELAALISWNVEPCFEPPTRAYPVCPPGVSARTPAEFVPAAVFSGSWGYERSRVLAALQEAFARTPSGIVVAGRFTEAATGQFAAGGYGPGVVLLVRLGATVEMKAGGGFSGSAGWLVVVIVPGSDRPVVALELGSEPSLSVYRLFDPTLAGAMYIGSEAAADDSP